MSRRRRSHGPNPLSAGRGPDDGLDPRKLDMERPNARKIDRKTRQLCGQVAQTLNFVLYGELDDDLLRTLYVASVDPAPDSTRLLVTVQPQLSGETVDVIAVLERLNLAKGLLRSEVASSIHRKKAPDLVFRFAEFAEPPIPDGPTSEGPNEGDQQDGDDGEDDV